MFKAHTKLSVLNTLNEKSLSGYDLMKYLGECGQKPSPGYVYPLLNDLEKKEFITVQHDERRKIYSITTKGKKLLEELRKNRKEMIGKMTKFWGNIADKKEMEEFDKSHLHCDKEIMEKFHKALFIIHTHENSTNRKKIINIINEAIAKMEKL